MESSEGRNASCTIGHIDIGGSFLNQGGCTQGVIHEWFGIDTYFLGSIWANRDTA